MGLTQGAEAKGGKAEVAVERDQAPPLYELPKGTRVRTNIRARSMGRANGGSVNHKDSILELQPSLSHGQAVLMKYQTIHTWEHHLSLKLGRQPN
jgi:hypothetical protein